MQRTQVKKGIAKQVEMIALETYDRDREPEQGEHAQHDGSAEGEQLEAQHLVRSPLPSSTASSSSSSVIGILPSKLAMRLVFFLILRVDDR